MLGHDTGALPRQVLLLSFGIFKLVLGLLLMVSPSTFLQLQGFLFASPISEHGGFWPHFASVSHITVAIIFLSVYWLRYDLMYSALIMSRIVITVPGYLFMYFAGDANKSFLVLFGALDATWSLLTLLTLSSQKIKSSKAIRTNLKMPSTAFQMLLIGCYVGEAALAFFAPNTMADLLGIRVPLRPFWAKWFGLELLSAVFLVVVAIRKNCSILVVNVASFGKIAQLLLISITIVFGMFPLHLRTLLYLGVQLLLLFWTVFSIAEDEHVKM